MEDIARHRADKDANSSTTHRYDFKSKAFEDITWANLETGDFVRIRNRETVPADVVILSVAKTTQISQGLCYVETKSLDGETNLKLRLALPNTADVVTEGKLCLSGKIEMEHPNKLIDSFSGTIHENKLGREVISEANILLRGCVLRNTDWIIGIVVNTGIDTKIMMSATETLPKSSFLEIAATTEILRIMAFLALLSFIGATGMVIWNQYNDVDDIPYLLWNPNAVSNWFIQFFYILLLHATFIPVSLYVSMTIARFGQSYFMENDLEMYYEKTDTPMKCRTRTLNEELGQISHIFSDKTGTLTCNIMDFRKASISGTVYGMGITEIGKAAWKLQGKDIPLHVLEAEAIASQRAKPHVSFYCPKYEQVMKQKGITKEKKDIQKFFKILSLCHDVIPENVDGVIKLSASNPDDEALVAAASYFGFCFSNKRDKNVILNISHDSSNKEEEVEILETIAFTSKRKRMAVIFRDTDGIIKLIMKGAETTMLPCMKEGQDEMIDTTLQHMNSFSEEGLRCLLVGEAIIPEEEFQLWWKKYRDASTNMVEIENRKKGMKNDIEQLETEIEKDLTLIGCTAIEDKLQDGVPECIALLAAAGLNIWVLTGDKEETAINIAVACNLVLPSDYMQHIIVNEKRCNGSEAMRVFFENEINIAKTQASTGKNGMQRALIIDGPSLLIALADTGSNGVRELLLSFSRYCKVVVGCRVSPDQKREMVNLVKEGVPGVRTLSVGDGANDVAMIQEAHIGVGIKGEEGMQAVNASDFAIAQFRYLKVLLLKHGRYNYIRMSSLIIYNFYKNIFMSMGQYWFNINNGFSGQKYYTEIGIQSFNTPLTFFPILLYAVYDMDVRYVYFYFFINLFSLFTETKFPTNFLLL